jgi:hypothetical protein
LSRSPHELLVVLQTDTLGRIVPLGEVIHIPDMAGKRVKVNELIGGG